MAPGAPSGLERSPEASSAGVEGGTALDARGAVLVYNCLKRHRCVVGDASGGVRLWALGSNLGGTECCRLWEAPGAWAAGLALSQPGCAGCGKC